jgi:hypothetical protein
MTIISLGLLKFILELENGLFVLFNLFSELLDNVVIVSIIDGCFF